MKIGRRVQLALAGAALLAIAAFALISSSPPLGPRKLLTRGSHPAVAGRSPAQTGQLASALAREMGDQHPTHIEIVSSTRGAALKVISPEEQIVGGAPPTTPVRVFAIRGHFTARGPRPPHSGPAPKGTWLTISVDTATGMPLDLSLTDQRPPLARLGEVNDLTTPQSPR